MEHLTWFWKLNADEAKVTPKVFATLRPRQCNLDLCTASSPKQDATLWMNPAMTVDEQRLRMEAFRERA